MKINQYCSVCKQHLDMEIIPTDDAGDDGVIWMRCPQCQGFLPKFSAEGMLANTAPVDDPTGSDAEAAGKKTAFTDRTPSAVKEPVAGSGQAPAGDLGTDSIHRESTASSRYHRPGFGDRVFTADDAEAAEAVAAQKASAPSDTSSPAEPLAEYVAALARADLSKARPYRATETFAVGDVVHHLAYGDVGIVVAKEKLPGGRRAVKVYFEETGIVHLIEQSPADGR